MTQRHLHVLMHKAVYFIPNYELQMIFQVFFSSQTFSKTWSQISFGADDFSYWWFRLDLRKQRVIYNFNFLKACELNMLGFNNATVMLNSSCICLCEWWLKRQICLHLSLLTPRSLLYGFAFICSSIVISIFGYSCKKSDVLDQNRYSPSAFVTPGKSYSIRGGKKGRRRRGRGLWLVSS